MDEKLKTAVLGGIVGAAVALAAVFAAEALGIVPGVGDARIHAYLMAHPSIVFDMATKAQADQADQEQTSRQKVVDKLGAKAFFDPAVAYVTGPANAKNSFVEFFDYNCVHCRNSFPAVKKFYESHKNDTRFAFIELPINGPASTNAARAAIAARAQGDAYVRLHFLLMGEKEAIDTELLFADAKKAGIDMVKLTGAVTTPAVDKALVAGRKLAEEAQVNGTPAFIINGHVHDGELTDADVKTLLK
jgi:protein-disulfide isomerase